MEATPEFAMNPESREVMRRHQIMRVLCKYPRITVGEVGRKTGLSKTYCWNLIEGMIYRGLVVDQKGGQHRGVDTRVYLTAYDHVKSGGNVPELEESEITAMVFAQSQGMGAAQWYGYASAGDEIAPIQEMLF
jgi:hypothetical protein